MRKLVLGCLGAVLAIAIHCAVAEVQAEDCYPCETVCNPCDNIFNSSVGCGPKSTWFLTGHMEAGLFVNEYGRKNAYDSWTENGPSWYSGNTGYLQNVHNADAQLNQLDIKFGKTLNSRRGWDVGGQIEFMYGTDARFAQAAGMEYDAGHGRWSSGDYYSALPQAFFEVGYKTLSVKVGKFYTPMGHDTLNSQDRFFYSLSMAFGALPVTHSGAVVTWTPNSKLSIFGGWVNGENQFFETEDDKAFLGGFTYKFNKRLRFAYSVMIGDMDPRDENIFGGHSDKDYFVQSFIVGYKPGKRWDYTFEWTLRNEKAKRAVWGGKDYDGAYGINNELIYRLNSKWAVGVRAEWLHEYWGGGSGDNAYSFSLGANWTPRSWLVIRPELRYDKFEGYDEFASKNYDKWNKDQLSGGFSAVVKF